MTEQRFTSERIGICGRENLILASMSAGDRATIEASGEVVEVGRGQALLNPGDAISSSFFPNVGTVVSMCLLLADGRTVEAATIGCEGVVGGVVSCGTRPALAGAIVQIPGAALRVPVRVIETMKDRSPSFRRLFDRYSEFLFSQAMQSVACNTFHTLEARLCRWLLTTQDRVGASEIPLTQEGLADMLGVQRSTVSTMSRGLQDQGILKFRRGHILIADRDGLRHCACECYDIIERHRLTVTAPGPSGNVNSA